MLTLTGPPGSGKTRLALELAAGLASSFPDGVALVPLDTVSDGRGGGVRGARGRRAARRSCRSVCRPGGAARPGQLRARGGRVRTPGGVAVRGVSTAAGAVRDRHARYYAGLAEQAYLERRGPNRSWWVRGLGEEYPNLRAAMVWLRSTRDEELSLRYACALSWFWRRFATRDALDWLREVLPAGADAVVASAENNDRLRALVGAGSLALRLSVAEARDYFQRAARLAHALADQPMEAMALSFMASTSV
jgi:hypothetical protein